MNKAWAIAALAFLAGCGRVPYELYQCPEPLKITDCKKEGSWVLCTFENTGQVSISRLSTAWAYDDSGVMMSNRAVLTQDIRPGQRKRLDVMVENNPSKVVICTVDPSHPYVAERVTRVR
ncbi:hypothetical protein [Herminiimonas arsenitoxidans]|uniref:hypothetical protein n=1 Tax=Herminiimonas arsenitoxidans TaxID=1809410 RepID=UPI0012FFC5A8|nr:hypothetical protein [Herminiimonas arsenitoxidans]